MSIVIKLGPMMRFEAKNKTAIISFKDRATKLSLEHRPVLRHLYENTFGDRFSKNMKNPINIMCRQMAFNLFWGVIISGTVSIQWEDYLRTKGHTGKLGNVLISFFI